MLIRHLEFSGIGPFKGRHVIDMDDLAAQGVFLIEGPTGSGKSTIIDAIVFALFGSVAGKDSTDKRMRSSHAPLSEISWVDLVFTVASGTYRIKRTPAQEIARKKGSGTTKAAHNASLWKLSEAAVSAHEWDSGEALCTQARESSQMICEIVGMNKNQFVQTVVLPQGQFAEFLRLNSKDRAVLLERIFRTGIYKNMTDELKARAGKASDKISELCARYATSIDVWLSNEGLSGERKETIGKAREELLTQRLPSDSLSDSSFLDLLRAATSELEEKAKEWEMKAAATKLAEETARDAYAKGIALQKALEKRKELRAHLHALSSQHEDIEEMKTQCHLHDEATIVMLRAGDSKKEKARLTRSIDALIASAQSASTLISHYMSEHEELKEQLSLSTISSHLYDIKNCDIKKLSISASTDSEASEMKQKLSFFAQETDKLAEYLGKLSALMPLAEKNAGITQEIADTKLIIKQHEKSIISTRQKLQEIPKKRNDLDVLLADAHTHAGEKSALEKDAETLTTLMDTAEQIEKLYSKEKEAQDTLTAALSEHTKDKEIFDRLTRQWISSAASDLAQDLKDGRECPVCGSTHHPKPAQAKENDVTREMVDTAHKRLEERRDLVTSAQSKLESLQTKIKTLKDQLGSDSVSSLRKKLNDISSRLESAHNAEKDIPAIEEKIKQLDSSHEILMKDIAAAEQECARLDAENKKNSAYLNEQEKELKNAIGSFESIQDKYRIIEEIRASIIQVHDSAMNEQEIRKAYQRMLDELSTALKESPFDTPEAAQQARLSPEKEKALHEKIDTYNDSWNAVQTQLKAPDIAELTGEEKVDISALNTTCDKTRCAYEAAAARAARNTQFAAEAQQQLHAILKASKAWHEAGTAAGPICRLANIANAGDTSLTGIPLNIWVLLKRFERVVNRANEHLKEISSGRYELIRVDESARNRKAGLDLQIIDRDGSPLGDQQRDTASLSGGETFYTSLALALALAEIVQEEQGGIRIDTLLIDEGFGTLSDDVREAVMHTLTSLSAHGRIVGIVSHVAELKQLVRNRISLRRLPDGSSTLTTIC